MSHESNEFRFRVFEKEHPSPTTYLSYIDLDQILETFIIPAGYASLHGHKRFHFRGKMHNFSGRHLREEAHNFTDRRQLHIDRKLPTLETQAEIYKEILGGEQRQKHMAAWRLFHSGMCFATPVCDLTEHITCHRYVTHPEGFIRPPVKVTSHIILLFFQCCAILYPFAYNMRILNLYYA